MMDFENRVTEWAKSQGKCIIDIEDYKRMQAESLELVKLKELHNPKMITHGLWHVVIRYECPVCGKIIIKDKDMYCSSCGIHINWKTS